MAQFNAQISLAAGIPIASPVIMTQDIQCVCTWQPHNC